MKCGHKTTEFYIALIGLVGAFLLAVMDVDASQIAPFVSIVATYIGARSYVKK